MGQSLIDGAPDGFRSCEDDGGHCLFMVSLAIQCAHHEVDSWDYDTPEEAQEHVAGLCMNCMDCQKCQEARTQLARTNVADKGVS